MRNARFDVQKHMCFMPAGPPEPSKIGRKWGPNAQCPFRRATNYVFYASPDPRNPPKIGRTWGAPGPPDIVDRRTTLGNPCCSKSGWGTGWAPSKRPQNKRRVGVTWWLFGRHFILKIVVENRLAPSGCPTQNANFQNKMPPKGPPRM
jgi:hypothetical protein